MPKRLNGFPQGLNRNSEHLRINLLAQCKAYCDLTGTPWTMLSKQLTNNSAFLTNVQYGSNLTFSSHDKALEKLRNMWPRKAPKSRKTGTRPSA